MCCRGDCLLKCLAWSLVLGALLFIGVRSWMQQKSYIFDHEELAEITRNALKKKSPGGDHEEVFALVESELRIRYADHILLPSQMEWIFVNAGGWMGAMYVLHASTTEYVLFFGTAVDTSGHSGRYWANISDTLVSGEYIQWKEGTTRTNVYTPGDTVFHGIGETAAIQWKAPFWAVEYGRGFIPSTLGFALADTFFGTQDYVIAYKTVRIYTIALFREIMQGNF